MADNSGAHRTRILDTINAPLGFFVLALLIVEAFLAAVLLGTTLQPSDAVRCVYLGVSMFVLVITVVAVLVWSKPDNLTFDRSAHLSRVVSKLDEDRKRDKKLEESLRTGMYLRMNRRHVEAMQLYEKALYYDPTCVEAQIGLAVAKSYAEPDDLSEPIRMLDRVIESHPNEAEALYNRACRRCLAETAWPKEQWLKDLQEALRLHPPFYDYLRHDDDFKKYEKDPDFIRVTTPLPN